MIYRDVELYNVVELLEDERTEGKLPLRIPNDLRLKLNVGAQAAALACSGCEIRFNLKGKRARIVLKSREQPSIAEVYQGCFHRAWQPIGLEPTEILVELPSDLVEGAATVAKEHHLSFDSRLTRVVLPCRPPLELIGIEGDFELPRPDQVPPKRHLAYGSSITHCSQAIRPTGGYAHKTAQLIGFDVINLGFGGGAHLEPDMADYIAERDDWDIATLEMGINLLWFIDVDEFAKRVDYFVTTIARAHPDQWVFCTDLFTCRADFAGDPKVGAFREVVRGKVQKLQMPRLVYVPGTELLTSPCGLTIDLVHPSPLGMEEIAGNLSNLIRQRIG